MLELIVYQDIHAFYEDTYEILIQDERKNLIILGNLLIGVEGKDRTGWRDARNWFMATVKEQGNVVLTALMTPPHNLTLYETGNVPNDAALALLAEQVSSPGVLAESDLAQRFSQICAQKQNLLPQKWESQRIYSLTQVNPIYLKEDAYLLRPVEPKDMSFLPYWYNGFHEDCYGEREDLAISAQAAEHSVATHRLFILEDQGVPVTMAGNHRNMLHVGGVGPVYTPPYFRNRGYASICVAQLSQQILDSGKQFCVLYTDLTNPTSNSIYQKIGYRPVCDSTVIRFAPASE